MYRDAAAWDALMSRLVRATVRYLNAQIAAGAQAVQLFDSWVGCLGPDDYRRYVLPYTQGDHRWRRSGRAGDQFRHRQSGPACRCSAEAGGHVIGVDWRIELDDAWRAIGQGKAVQGNLDPAVLAFVRRRNPPPHRPHPPASRRPPRPHLQPRPRRASANAAGKRDRAGRGRA